jgi:hypothetical protein
MIAHTRQVPELNNSHRLGNVPSEASFTRTWIAIEAYSDNDLTRLYSRTAGVTNGCDIARAGLRSC